MAQLRFDNFLERNGLQFEMVPMSGSEDALAGRALVASHFKHLHNADKANGSLAIDYDCLLDHPLPHGGPYLSLLGVLSRQGPRPVRIPMSLFLGEELGMNHGGLYCTITRRELAPVVEALGSIDETGFSAISQYAYARAFAAAARMGWRTIDLGGSETADLDRFKRQLGCQLLITGWRVTDASREVSLSHFADSLS
jgi:hypothetical protein